MNTLRINHVAVWICVVLMHGFGFLWYGPFFGDKWMSLVELDPATMNEMSSGMGIWITNSVAIIASIYFLSWMLTKMNIKSGAGGAAVAFLAVFCLHHLPLMNTNMFAGEPYSLTWITGGYSLAGLTLTGFVLGAWVKFSDRL